MIEEIIEILKKEAQSGYKNTTVFGGLPLLIKNLIKKYDNNLLFPEVKEKIFVISQLLDYDNLSLENRKKLLNDILEKLSNNSLQKQDSYLNNNYSTITNGITNDYTSQFLLEDLPQGEFSYEEFLNKELSLFSKELKLNKKLLYQLRRSNIKTLYDLLWFLPRSYSDRTKSSSFSKAVNYEKSYLILDVISDHQIINNQKIKVIKYVVRDQEGNLGEMVFFNQEFMTFYIKKGMKIRSFGRVVKNSIAPEEWEHYDKKTIHFDRIVPIYSTSINQKKIREIIALALKLFSKKVVDPLLKIIHKFFTNESFLDLSKSIVYVHFPPSFDILNLAKKRLALEEIIYTQVFMNTYSQNIENKYKIDKDYALKILDSLELPFSLTDAQKRVINDIINDFSSDRVSRRLVQGDVGTGKTIVAMIASLIMAKNGYQSSLMAPTELLATQHYNNFKKIMKDLKVELLTSKIKGKKREQILDLLKRGEIDVLVGTHSLLNDNVEFKNLALIVIDEQHKFGVLQRLRLYSKSSSPHLIVMSATPIPRTLALTVYSDLDISIIDKGPPGRKKAITEIFNYKDINKVFSFIEKQLEEGRQVFVVCPSIYDNPKLEIKNVQEVYEQFKERFKSYHVSYLHGKMSSKEKDKIMESFRDNEIAILITTTVVEVGIDVPNANTIVILDSERFGLSQLHQLRGRVKRSNHQPYCLLITSKNLSLGDYNKSLQRLNILKYYDDGFSVAEKDLELRGPGEVLGYKQHGFTEFKALDPIKDINLIKKSNELAKKLVNFIDKSEFFKRKIEAIKLHQDDLVDIGGMV